MLLNLHLFVWTAVGLLLIHPKIFLPSWSSRRLQGKKMSTKDVETSLKPWMSLLPLKAGASHGTSKFFHCRKILLLHYTKFANSYPDVKQMSNLFNIRPFEKIAANWGFKLDLRALRGWTFSAWNWFISSWWIDSQRLFNPVAKSSIQKNEWFYCCWIAGFWFIHKRITGF